MRISQMASTNAAYYLNKATTSMNKSAQKLASGKRILSAADDPSGLIRLQGLKTHMATAKVEQEGLASAMEFAKMRDSALMEISGIVTQLKGIYAQGDNYDQEAASALQAEIGNVLSSKYAGQDLFGNAAVTIGDISFAASTLSSADFTKDKIDNYTPEGESDPVDGGATKLAKALATVGAQEVGIEARTKINQNTLSNLEEAIGRIEEVDVEAETINYNKQYLLQQIGTAVIGKQNSAMSSILNLFA